MSNFVGIIVGGLEVVAGIVISLVPGGVVLGGMLIGHAIGAMLIAAGVGMLIAGVGTLMAASGSTGPTGATGPGISVASRNPVAPWLIPYGRNCVGGTVVYINSFGQNNVFLDMVIVLASCQCEAVDELLFDKQLVQLSSTPGVPWNGSVGDSFQPLQQEINIITITRVKSVVTVVMHDAIPLLGVGDRIQIQNTGLQTANGIWRIEQIPGGLPWNIGTAYTTGQIVEYNGVSYSAISNNTGHQPDVSGGIWGGIFSYIAGGVGTSATNGQVVTQWPDYGSKIHMEVLLGNQVTTFPGMLYGTPLDGDYGNLIGIPTTDGGDFANPWTATAVLTGKTAVFLRLHFDAKVFAGGIPQISFLIRGKKDVYDPRTSTTGYTENAALCIADYLSNTTYGFKAVYDTEIPYAPLIAAANVCDEAMPLAAGGTEPRYALNGKFTLDHSRGEILQNLLTACAGRLTYTGGQFIIWPGVWYGSSPAAAPGLAQMNGPFRWKSTLSIRDLYNGVKGTYICPSNNWQAGDIPPYAQDTSHGYTIGPAWSSGTSYVIGNIVAYSSEDYIALTNNVGHQPDISPTQWALTYQDINLIADNGERRWKDIQLPFTISSATAQRICKIELMRCRQQGTGTFRFNMAGYSITVMDVISMTLPIFGWTGKLFEVLSHRFVLSKQDQDGIAVTVLGVEIDIQEIDASVYDWSDTEELTPQGYQQSALPNPFEPAAITGLTLESDETTLVVTPQGVADSILVTWNEPSDSYADYVINGGHLEVQYELVENYSDGTIAATAGSVAIVGTGTAWTDDMTGETIVINGVSFAIGNVVDNFHMNLFLPYSGTTISGSLYLILYSSAWIGLPSVNPTVTQLHINGVIDDEQYNVRIRAVNHMGVPSPWTTAGPVLANGQNAPLSYKPYAQAYLFAPHGYGIDVMQIAGGTGENSIAISGTAAVNAFSGTITGDTLIDPYAIVSAHTGNSLLPGFFVAQVFPIDSGGLRGQGSKLTQFTVTAAAQRVSFTVTLPAGTTGYEVFIGPDPDNLIGQGAQSGVPTTINIDVMNPYTGYGPPDKRVYAYHARAKRTIHGGIAAAGVLSSANVGPFGTVTIAVPGSSPLNTWAGRYLILASKAGLPETQIYSILPIAGSDTGNPNCTLNVSVPGTLVGAGDLVLISTLVTSSTLNSVTDTGWVSVFAPGGLGMAGSPPSGVEPGNQVVILYDPTGAVPSGETRDIIANDGTTITVGPNFSAAPGIGSVFIVVEKAWRTDVVSSNIANSAAPTFFSSPQSKLIALPTVNLAGYVALVQLMVQDKFGTDSFEEGDGLRMLYIVPPAGTTAGTVTSYPVPVVGGVATPDASQGTNLLILTGDTQVAAPINYVPTSGIDTPWTLITQEDPVGLTGGHSTIFDATYFMNIAIATPNSPANTQCHVDFKTNSNGKTYLAGQPSIDQPIPV